MDLVYVRSINGKEKDKIGDSSQGNTRYRQRSFAQLNKIIKADYEAMRNWRKVAKKWGINPGMAFMIAKRYYEPKDPHIRTKLGLPTRTMVTVCAKCGEAHVSKRCTKERQRWKDLFGTPVEELRRMLEERQ